MLSEYININAAIFGMMTNNLYLDDDEQLILLQFKMVSKIQSNITNRYRIKYFYENCQYFISSLRCIHKFNYGASVNLVGNLYSIFNDWLGFKYFQSLARVQIFSMIGCGSNIFNDWLGLK